MLLCAAQVTEEGAQEGRGEEQEEERERRGDGDRCPRQQPSGSSPEPGPRPTALPREVALDGLHLQGRVILGGWGGCVGLRIGLR